MLARKHPHQWRQRRESSWYLWLMWLFVGVVGVVFWVGCNAVGEALTQTVP